VIGDVDLLRATESARAVDLLDDFVELARGSRRDGDARTFSRKPQSDGSPDAATAARDEHSKLCH
jgi:hypothetical protein